ncbi:MAG: hypothetical protein ACI841_000454 [Planctomycetota bacterium]|jgi:hypothetical protein
MARDAFDLSDTQHPPLAGFNYAWRWLEENHYPLPQAELDRIRPLDDATAKRAWDYAMKWHAKDVFDARPSAESFGTIDTLEQPHEHDAVNWLTQRLAGFGRLPIIVSWQPGSGVLTDAELFTERWESFCYPASDDVDIWPLDASWVVTYWHEEQLWFGRD